MPSLEFKSYSANITLTYLDSDNLEHLDAALAEKLANAPGGFFTASPIVADLSRLNGAAAPDLSALRSLFARHGLTLCGISGSELDDEAVAARGLAKFEIADIRQAGKSAAQTPPPPKPEQSTKPAAVPPLPPPAANNKILRSNIRSGQRIYAQGGDLTIIGSVGAGAEVIADGNIYILGSLRGRAFAGAQGDESTHIFTTDFDAELVSIAGNYQNFEQLNPYHGGKNCLISLNKDETMLIVSL